MRAQVITLILLAAKRSKGLDLYTPRFNRIPRCHSTLNSAGHKIPGGIKFYGAAELTEKSTLLEECKTVYEKEDETNWEALQTYKDCLQKFDCKDDAYCAAVQKEWQEDVEEKINYWGREWNIRDSSPHRSPAMAVVAIPTFIIVMFIIL